jgi:integrase
MKGDREHRVPLEPRVVAILREMAEVRLSEFVFPGRSENRPISDLGLRMLVRELRPGVTIHGFRSSFRDWAAEMTSFPNHVVDGFGSCDRRRYGGRLQAW